MSELTVTTWFEILVIVAKWDIKNRWFKIRVRFRINVRARVRVKYVD